MNFIHSFEPLYNALEEAKQAIAKKSIDTFNSRMRFRHDFGFTDFQQDMIRRWLAREFPVAHPVYRSMRTQINKQEFFVTEYYRSPSPPRNVRGAYRSVILDTIAGILSANFRDIDRYFPRSAPPSHNRNAVVLY